MHDNQQGRSRTVVALFAAGVLALTGCTTVNRTGLEVGAGSGGVGSASGGTVAGSAGQNPGTSGTGSGSSSGSAGSGGNVGATGVGSNSTSLGGSSAAGFGSGTVGTGPVGTSRSGTVGTGPAGTAGSNCAHAIKVGISYSSDESTGLSAVGNPGAAAQNANAVQQEQNAFQLIANSINASGGIGGCSLQLVYHDFKSLGSDGFSGESQTECTDFAQDQHVFAAIPTVLENKTVITCLGQAHVIDFYSSSSGTYQPNPNDFATYAGYLYQPDAISSHRFGAYIADLQRVGYLGSGAKVGILLADDGTGNNQYLVNNVWTPQLEAIGIKPVVFTFHAIQGYSDVADATSQFDNAVLEFKAAGVNRVMFTPDGGDGTIFFTQTASSQNYSPRYALTSDSGPAAWSTEPASERPGAVDLSWGLLDLGTNATPAQVAAAGSSPVRTRCNSILNGHTGATSPSTFYVVCDSLILMQQALRDATSVTPQTLLSGVNALGTSFGDAAGYANATFSAPNHYDGGSAVRVLAWNEAAQAWQFATGPLAVPPAAG